MYPAIFYFEFYNSDTDESRYFGFNFSLPESSPVITDSEPLDPILDELESEYGVHDWSSSPVDGLLGIGYTSYEVDENRYFELMDRWRSGISSLPGVADITDVVELHNLDIDNFDDSTLHSLVYEAAGK